MNIQQRIFTCRLLNKMEQHKQISAELGLENGSKFITTFNRDSGKEEKEVPER